MSLMMSLYLMTSLDLMTSLNLMTWLILMTSLVQKMSNAEEYLPSCFFVQPFSWIIPRENDSFAHLWNWRGSKGKLTKILISSFVQLFYTWGFHFELHLNDSKFSPRWDVLIVGKMKWPFSKHIGPEIKDDKYFIITQNWLLNYGPEITFHVVDATGNCTCSKTFIT